jgi:NTP pyrophosphatase (non-canonical NTP hydrolase)
LEFVIWDLTIGICHLEFKSLKEAQAKQVPWSHKVIPTFQIVWVLQIDTTRPFRYACAHCSRNVGVDKMDENETIKSLRDRVIQFRDARDWEQFHDPKNLAMGLSIECAELLELFLWKSDNEIDALFADPSQMQKVRNELADVCVFLLYLSKACQVDLSDAVKDKITLNEKKYPVDKFYGSNKKYDK